MHRPARLTILTILCAALAACGGEISVPARSPSTLPSLADVPTAAWERLAERQVFFGHQSVGGNLVDGLATTLRAHPGIRLTIQETKEFGTVDAPAFRHAAVGRNYHPIEKLDEFARIVAAAPAEADPLAMVKLCYVDVETNPDADALFAEYQRRIAAIRAQAPHLTIVHVTMPLTIIENWKGRLVTTVLRRPSARGHNAVRHRYNELLRAAYAGKEPLFDIAELESTRSDGTRAAFRFRGETIPMLAPEHASDGAHLTPAAAARFAEQLLVTLATVPGRDTVKAGS